MKFLSESKRMRVSHSRPGQHPQSFEQQPSPGLHGIMRAEFTAAPAANTARIVNRQRAVLYGDCSWRADAAADATQHARFRVGSRICGKVAFKRPCQETGQPELNVLTVGQPETGYRNSLNR